MVYIIISLYLFLYIVALWNTKNAIFLYIFFIPIQNLINIQFFGVLSFNGVFAFILFFHFLKNGYVKLFFTLKNKYLKELLNFTIIAITIMLLNTVRQDFLLQDYLNIPVTVTMLIGKITIYIITIINLGVLIKFFLSFNNIRPVIYKSMFFSLLTIVLSIYFASYLNTIGLNAIGVIKNNIKPLDELNRISGFFTGGDVNALSTTLNLVISIILINAHSLRKNLSLWEIGGIVLLSTGVFLTGSRMGFVTLLIIFTYYFLFLLTKQNRKTLFSISNIFYFITALIVIFILIRSHNKFQLVFERISNQGLTSEIEEGGSRFIRWIRFISFTFENLKRALLGSNEIYYVFKPGVYRDPHSFFIRTLYLNGILILILFIRSFIKLFLSIKKMQLLKYNIIMSIIILISLTIISQTIFLNFYLLYLGSLIHQKIYEDNQKGNPHLQY